MLVMPSVVIAHPQWDNINFHPTIAQSSILNAVFRICSARIGSEVTYGAVWFLAREFYEFQFFIPLRPGDLITSTTKIGGVYEREGKSGRKRTGMRTKRCDEWLE
jgi:hypothetical protein